MSWSRFLLHNHKRKEDFKRMEIKSVEVTGLEFALKAMRMPFESHDRSTPEKDLKLAERLIKAGVEHRKFIRQITINVDVIASMAFWFEFDTYKIGVTSNSSSFWNQHGVVPSLSGYVRPDNADQRFDDALLEISHVLKEFLCAADPPKEVMRYLIPQGVKYHRAITITGEAFLNMLIQRQNHRLPEWREFLSEILARLPQDVYNLYDPMVGDKMVFSVGRVLKNLGRNEITLNESMKDCALAHVLWKPYPANKPEKVGEYFVTRQKAGMVYVGRDADYYNGVRFLMKDEDTIAFAEIPDPYSPKSRSEEQMQ